MTQDSPEFRILVTAHNYDGYQDPELWLRDLLHKLQPSVREWWCAPPVVVIRNVTFLYFVDEIRLVRSSEHPCIVGCSDDVIEASPESVRPSPTSVCSVTESAGQKILRIAISAR